MKYNVACIPGDGIGPEIVAEAKKVLNKIAEKYGHEFDYTEVLMGGVSIDAHGVPLTDEALETARKSDAVLLGAVGGRVGVDSWYELPPNLRPEAGLLAIRKGLGLFANLRPSYLYPENEIRRIVVKAFDIAMKRRKKVTSVDKANVLDSSRLWRKIVAEVAKDYPEVTVEDMLVDNCAMQLVKDPAQFDVVVTENMFGDILSDEASMVTGSIGMLSSASLSEGKLGLYEPSHGAAPDIAGQNIANPIATILSAAMMLRYSFDLDKEADAVENAVKQVLKDGIRTVDIMTEGCTQVSCSGMGDAICERI